MNHSLYRKEVTQRDSQGLYGNVMLRQPRGLKWGVYLLVVAVAGMLLMLGQAGYHRQETVTGQLMPEQGVTKTHVPQAGVIAEMHVKQGDAVEKGDVLMKIRTQKHLTVEASIGQQRIENLNSQKQDIEIRMEAEKDLAEHEKQRMAVSLQHLQQSMLSLQQRLSLSHSQQQLAQRRLDKVKALHKQSYATLTEVERHELEVLNNAVHRQSIEGEKLETARRIDELKSSLQQVPIKLENTLNQLHTSLQQLDERIIELQAADAYLITAAASGVVTNQQGHVGQSVVNGQYVLSIIPQNARLVAALYVPSRSRGFIAPHQQVGLRYDAFPHQQFGVFKGQVIEVSESSVLPSEVERPLPYNEPVYRVLVAPDEQQITDRSEPLILSAGMTLTADIVLERRSLMDWLMSSFNSIKNRNS